MKLSNNYSDSIKNYFNENKEVQTAALGVTVGAVSNVALNYLSTSKAWRDVSNLASRFLQSSCCAGSIAGTVMSVYSLVQLGKKIVSQNNSLKKNLSITTLGAFLSATANTISSHFWEITPSFRKLGKHSLGYILGTNFALQASMITALSSTILLGYASYSLGKYIINSRNGS